MMIGTRICYWDLIWSFLEMIPIRVCVHVCVCVCVKSIIKLILKISMLYHMFIPHNKKERDMVVEGEKKGERERKNK